MVRRMGPSGFSRIVVVAAPGLLAVLSACASAPNRINDVCAVFAQNDGWINNWHSAAKRAERKYGVPVPILMATVRKESGFKSNARPPRTKLLGFIPWKRQSSAYGYSQALDGTWAEYKVSSGNMTARRGNFADAVDFVGWYHNRSAEKLGVARNDTYNLYLAYYHGWSAYQRGNITEAARKTARDTADMALNYSAQLKGCD